MAVAWIRDQVGMLLLVPKCSACGREVVGVDEHTFEGNRTWRWGYHEFKEGDTCQNSGNNLMALMPPENQ